MYKSSLGSLSFLRICNVLLHFVPDFHFYRRKTLKRKMDHLPFQMPFDQIYLDRLESLTQTLDQFPIVLIQLIKDYDRSFRGLLLYHWRSPEHVYESDVHGDWVTL